MSATRATPADLLAGILPAVISGGRPQLKQRPTSKFLPDLRGLTADPVWVVLDEHAGGYEDDGHELVTYSREWAEEYAASHWTALQPFESGGFLGAFPGREHACRVAAERGCWAVLQLDDNIIRLGCVDDHKAGMSVARTHGGLALYADVFAAVSLSTNGAMTGGRLGSVAGERRRYSLTRPGFTYSLFLERTGTGREEWFGPFEDDITHAYQYGSSASADTCLIVPALRYTKESSSGSGMRTHYNHQRAAGLQRMFPESARIAVMNSKSNGTGGPRVFHKMSASAIRTPLAITDRELFAAAKTLVSGIVSEWYEQTQANIHARVHARAGRL